MKMLPPVNDVLRSELIAAIIGALLVIPQAISFSFLAGVEPEYGLYCAIFMGLLTSLIGKSPVISGPNTAVAILVGTTLIQFADRGSAQYASYLALLTAMVTLFQFAFYTFKWHRIFDYINPVTIKAISTCVGILIIASSLNGLIGAPSGGSRTFWQKLVAFPDQLAFFNPYVFAVAITTICSGLITKVIWPKYYLAIALVCGLGAGLLIDQLYSRDISQMARLSLIEIELMPFHLPLLAETGLARIKELLLPAAAIAYLGLSQTLVIAKGIEATPGIADIAVPKKWRPLLVSQISLRREVLAQAVGNLSSVFLGAYAGSGSFNRTMVNLAVGSKTKLAGIFSAVFVWLFIMVFAPYLAVLPMAVIDGSLFIVGVAMIKPKEIGPILGHSRERWLFIIVIATLLFMGLTAGIAVALVLSIGGLALATSRIHWQQEGGEHLVRGHYNYVTAREFEHRLATQFTGKSAKQLAATTLDLSGLITEDSSHIAPLAELLRPYRAKGLRVIDPASAGQLKETTT